MASPIGYVAYIDEAGDDGIKFVAPIDPGGASEWFVLGAFVVPIHEDTFVQQWLAEAMIRLSMRQRNDIHFAKLSDARKEIVCRYLSSLNFRWFVSVSHKPNMRGHRNTKVERARSKNYFYNWMARVLLEKVTKYCSVDAHTRYRGKPQHKLRIEFSTRGGMFIHTRKIILLNYGFAARRAGSLTKKMIYRGMLLILIRSFMPLIRNELACS